mgnify:CR=1 FL=1
MARSERSSSTGPKKKNALTLDAYAELRDLFRGLSYASDIKAVVICGAGGNFSLRRRRARNHRAADDHEHARAASLHSHDGRSGEGNAVPRRSRS